MKISRIFEIAASILFLTVASLPAAQMAGSNASSKGKSYGVYERGTTEALTTTATTTTKAEPGKAVTRGMVGKVGAKGECICPPKKVKKSETRGVTGVTHKKHHKMMHRKAAPAVEPETRGFTGQCPADSSFSESRSRSYSYSESRGIEQPIQQQPIQQQAMPQSMQQEQMKEKVWSDEGSSTRGISPTCPPVQSNEQVSTRGVTEHKYRNHWFQFWRPKAPQPTYSQETVTTTRGVEKTRNHWFQFWRPKATSETSTYSTTTAARGYEEQPVAPAKKHHMFRHEKKEAPAMAPSETPAVPMEQASPATREVAPMERAYRESCPTGASVQGEVKRGVPSQDYGTRGGARLDNPRENRYYPEQPSLRPAAKAGAATRGASKGQMNYSK